VRGRRYCTVYGVSADVKVGSSLQLLVWRRQRATGRERGVYPAGADMPAAATLHLCTLPAQSVSVMCLYMREQWAGGWVLLLWVTCRLASWCAPCWQHIRAAAYVQWAHNPGAVGFIVVGMLSSFEQVGAWWELVSCLISHQVVKSGRYGITHVVHDVTYNCLCACTWEGMDTPGPLSRHNNATTVWHSTSLRSQQPSS
jgi:hypothetical protein